MALETPVWVSDFVTTNPADTDTANFGDDHLRNIKIALKNTFPRTARPLNFPLLTVKSGDYTVLATGTITDDNTLFMVTASGAARTITLPTAAGSAWNGFRVGIKKTDSSVNTVTVVRAGADTIEGGTSVVLRSQYDTLWLVYDGVSAWSVSNTPYKVLQTFQDDVIFGNPGDALDNGDVYYVKPYCSFAGTLNHLHARADSTGITVTWRINGVAVTTGVVVATSSGVNAIPSALNTFVVGDAISVITSAKTGSPHQLYLSTGFTRYMA